MKKVLFAFLLVLAITPFAIANTEGSQNSEYVKVIPQEQVHRSHRDSSFEMRLGLTEEQRMKARDIRYRGHYNIHPILQEIALKKQEAQMVKNSRIAVEVQEERLRIIDKEIKNLEKKANAVRKENLREFESILTRAQRNVLKQMKNEGRKKYHAEHPNKMQQRIPQTNSK